METACEADFASNRVIVSVKEGTDMKAVKESVDVKSVKLLDDGKTPGEKSTGFNIYEFTLKEKDKQNVLDSAETLKNVTGVSCAEPDYIIHVDAEKGKEANGPLFEQQSNLNQVKAPVCWNVATGKDVVVGVIDSGIDYNHPDLAANMWKNEGEKPGDGIDNDGNGYVEVAGSGLFVVAAGNEGGDNDVREHVPSSWKLDNILSVASVDSEGKLYRTSNYGATSVDIMSTYNIYIT